VHTEQNNNFKRLPLIKNQAADDSKFKLFSEEKLFYIVFLQEKLKISLTLLLAMSCKLSIANPHNEYIFPEISLNLFSFPSTPVFHPVLCDHKLVHIQITLVNQCHIRRNHNLPNECG